MKLTFSSKRAITSILGVRYNSGYIEECTSVVHIASSSVLSSVDANSRREYDDYGESLLPQSEDDPYYFSMATSIHAINTVVPVHVLPYVLAIHMILITDSPMFKIIELSLKREKRPFELCIDFYTGRTLMTHIDEVTTNWKLIDTSSLEVIKNRNQEMYEYMSKNLNIANKYDTLRRVRHIKQHWR